MNKEKNLTRSKLIDKPELSRPAFKFNFKLTNINIVICITLLIMFTIIAFTKSESLNNTTIIIFVVAEIISGFMPKTTINK